MKNLKIILWLCLPLLVSSCLQVGDDTLVLPAEDYTGNLKPTIDKEIIPEDIQEDLEIDMPIYEGTNPPDVTGAYLFNPLSLVYSSDGMYSTGTLLDDYAVRFTNLNSSTNTLSFDDWTKTNGYSSIADANIIGSGNDFTVYYVGAYTQNSKDYEYVILISGTLTSAGIKNAYYGYVFFEGGNLSYYDVTKDYNNLAENVTWGKSVMINSQETSNILRGARIQKK